MIPTVSSPRLSRRAMLAVLHGVTADIEMTSIEQCETAYSRMLKSDMKDRFVIDMASLPKAA